MTLRIDAPDGGHYALLTDDPAGVRVDIWRVAPHCRDTTKRLQSLVIDCPWHVALDRMHAILASI